MRLAFVALRAARYLWEGNGDDSDRAASLGMSTAAEWLERKCVVGGVIACTLASCAIYTPRNIDEQIRAVKEGGGTGCVYMRGNSRPYADMSVLMVSTIGKGTDYRECLEAVPEGARSLVLPQ